MPRIYGLLAPTLQLTNKEFVQFQGSLKEKNFPPRINITQYVSITDFNELDS